jgi:hypothetical protein
MNASEPKRRWFDPQPAWLIVLSLATTGFLFLSENYEWFAFNQQKGWTVLIAVACAATVLAFMLLWWLAALILRWPFQFTIRSLLVLVVVVALPCSWLAVAIKKSRGQRKAVEAIESLGGAVRYDWQDYLPGTYWGTPPPPRPQPGAAWLRRIVGGDFFASVEEVSLVEPEVTDAALENFRELPALQILYLDGTQTTDDGLENLRRLTGLENLSLRDTKITDRGLGYFRGLTNLQYLDLSGTEVTDAGLENLRGLTKIQQLWLHGAKVTDAGLEKLRGMTALQGLSLCGTNITDKGMELLREFPALEDLDVSSTQVTDAGVKKLKKALPNCKIEYYREP